MLLIITVLYIYLYTALDDIHIMEACMNRFGIFQLIVLGLCHLQSWYIGFLEDLLLAVVTIIWNAARQDWFQVLGRPGQIVSRAPI